MQRKLIRGLAVLLTAVLLTPVTGLTEAHSGNEGTTGDALLPVEEGPDDAPERTVEEAGGLLMEALEESAAERTGEALLSADGGERLPGEAEQAAPRGDEADSHADEADGSDAYQWTTLYYEHCVYTAKQGFYWHAGPSASEPSRGYVNAGQTVVSDAVIKNSTTNEMWLKKDGEEKYVFAGYRWSGTEWQLDTAQPQYLEYSRSDLSVTWSDDNFPSGMTLPQCSPYTLQGTLTANATIDRVNYSIYSKATGSKGTSGMGPLNSLKKTYTLKGSGVAQSVWLGERDAGDYRFELLVDFRTNRLQDWERLAIKRDFTITSNPDTVAPTIGKITVTELTPNYYTLSCPVSDNVRVKRVKFLAWTEINGQDDMYWHEGQVKDGVATCTININMHDGQAACVYCTQIYAYDAAGNYSCKSIKVELPRPVVLPTSVKLNKTEVTLLAGEKLTLKAKVSPSDAETTYTWTSSDTKVATVSKKGVVKAVGGGEAIITVWVKNGKLDNCRVKVPTPPTKIGLNETKATLKPGKKLTLKASLSPADAKTSLTWSSSNDAVATVSSKGVVKAVGGGKATITVKTANGKKATCKVKVVSDTKVKYRALLIGQEAFDPICRRDRGDVKLMAKMLGSVKGPEGGAYSVTKRFDLTASQIFRAIQSTFGSADENDVSLFFISTHGNDSRTDRYAGALSTPSGERVLIEELAEALCNVRGKVIVILESCGSGAAIYGNGRQNDEILKDIGDFDAAVIEAFRSIDPGLVVDAGGNGLSEDEIRSNTGELRISNKFYVLTSSRYLETSWGSEALRYNYFVKWLTQGVGQSGRMPADTDRDGTTTLKELYKYISKVGDHYKIRHDSSVFYQHVQAYPSNSSYKLFKR